MLIGHPVNRLPERRATHYPTPKRATSTLLIAPLARFSASQQ
ncbi:hypothetical protein AAGW18_02745 [Vreelandella titanicae]|nr:hypothetical protein [Halomonas titanicae]